MMIHPAGVAAFVEVPKTGSTAMVRHLNRRGGWAQNGKHGPPIPGTETGRHAPLTKEAAAWCRDNGITTYGVVRNPFDRMASLWRASGQGSFTQWMNRGRFRVQGIDVVRTPQLEWLQFVDRVLLYEMLEAEVAKINWDTGHMPKGPIERVNVSKRSTEPDWTDEALDLVLKHHQADLDVWGYPTPRERAAC